MGESLIVSASGIRGIVGEGLTPEVGARYGAAFGSYVREIAAPRAGERPRVLVGRDSRTSGPMLLDAVTAGLRAVGIDVSDMGVVSTPTGLLAVEESAEAAGGLLVTASHNPAEWNGLKLVAAEGRFLSPDAGRRVEALFREDLRYAGWDEVGTRSELLGANERHLERILSLPILDVEAIRARAFRIALDCVRGAGGLIVPALLERLGCQVVGIDLEPDGRFPRKPEPVPENLATLSRTVVAERADMGFAVDPDVDRLALVDESGTPAGEDWTLALVTELVASVESGPVVTNLSSSRSIEDAAGRAGVPFHRAPVGEANVVARMLEVGASVGGEGNGGVIYPGLHLTRDAPLAAALILQFVTRAEAPLGAILRGRPGYRIVKRKLDRGGMAIPEALQRVAAAAPEGVEHDRQDGLRLDWPDGAWVHVRPSGTEPILRIVAEAPQAERATEIADWVEARVTETTA